ncbi:hypothetical protein FRB94_008302 [Tulasnella sp. JGI-2019a]|nr:hypothetical protein FRB93_006996 [Tulasnella sp. JGI-2019a]KAG9011471.1 hypothetical protein FRB94_008302 [Tulasnella sp. JGI-2019a]
MLPLFTLPSALLIVLFLLLAPPISALPISSSRVKRLFNGLDTQSQAAEAPDPAVQPLSIQIIQLANNWRDEEISLPEGGETGASPAEGNTKPRRLQPGPRSRKAEQDTRKSRAKDFWRNLNVAPVEGVTNGASSGTLPRVAPVHSGGFEGDKPRDPRRTYTYRDWMKQRAVESFQITPTYTVVDERPTKRVKAVHAQEGAIEHQGGSFGYLDPNFSGTDI